MENISSREIQGVIQLVRNKMGEDFSCRDIIHKIKVCLSGRAAEYLLLGTDIVVSPRLLDVDCKTPEQMALADTLCWAAELGP